MPIARIKAGDTVHVEALVASVDHKKKTIKLSIGWGPNRTILVVPARLVSSQPSKAMREALTWANDLYGETEQ